jgi:hypothetical protein
MARIVLDAVAIADLTDHFEIEHGALVEALSFHQLALPLQFLVPHAQFFFDALERLFARGRRHHVVGLWIDRKPHIRLPHLPKHGIDLAKTLDLVSPQLDSISVVVVGWIDFDHVAAHAKRAARKAVIVAFVEDLHQPRGNLLAGNLLSLLEHQKHSVIGFGRPQAVNATDAGDDHAVAPFEQGARGGEPKFVQLVVDGCFFFDVDVAGWHVRFRLVVIVIADEVLDGVLWEERAEFVIKLRRERLVVR